MAKRVTFRSGTEKNGTKSNRKERRKAKKMSGDKKNVETILETRDVLIKKIVGDIKTLMDEGKEDEAKQVLEELLKDHSESADVRLAIGNLFLDLELPGTAYQHLKEAASLAPENVKPWIDLGTCLYKLKHHQAAIVALQMAIRLHPSNSRLYALLGMVYFYNDEHDLSLRALDQAIGIDPRDHRAHFIKGLQFQTLGDFETAKALFLKALKIKPDYVDVHFRLSAMRETADEPEKIIALLERELKNEKLSGDNRSVAHFTIAEILARQKNYDQAFPHYAKGNSLIHSQVTFDRDLLVERFGDTIKYFTPDIFEEMQEIGSDSVQPVFIIGMPRSGTTLVETIIASHPEAVAGGERTEISDIVRTLYNTQDGHEADPSEDVEYENDLRPLRYPDDITEMDRPALIEFRDSYLEAVRQATRPDVTRITDKMPLNFIHIGLIHLFYPNAKIVHCVRDPMDTCLSCYFHKFFNELSFTFDLDDLGFYYRQYEHLMGHWKTVFPGMILDVSYERMIEAQEEVSRELIAHVGLEWDDACLSFHKQKHDVKTASLWQVRQPIYKTSSGRWRRYEKFLQPLKEAL